MWYNYNALHSLDSSAGLLKLKCQSSLLWRALDVSVCVGGWVCVWVCVYMWVCECGYHTCIHVTVYMQKRTNLRRNLTKRKKNWQLDKILALQQCSLCDQLFLLDNYFIATLTHSYWPLHDHCTNYQDKKCTNFLYVWQLGRWPNVLIIDFLHFSSMFFVYKVSLLL